MGMLAEYGNFGLTVQNVIQESKPVLVGGGTALVATGACRYLGTSGSWIERHAGVIGALAGTGIAIGTKQGSTAVASALVVGLGIELVEYLSGIKIGV